MILLCVFSGRREILWNPRRVMREKHHLPSFRKTIWKLIARGFWAAAPPVVFEKAPSMDANALAALLTSNPELLTKVLQSIQTANNG